MASLRVSRPNLPKSIPVIMNEVPQPRRESSSSLRERFLEEERKLYDLRSEHSCSEPLVKLGAKYWAIHRVILNPYVYPISSLIEKPQMQEVKSTSGASGVIPNIPSLCQFVGFHVPRSLAENLTHAFPDEYMILK